MEQMTNPASGIAPETESTDGLIDGLRDRAGSRLGRGPRLANLSESQLDQMELAEEKQRENAPDLSFGEKWDAATQQEWVHNWMVNTFGRESYPADPKWQLTQDNLKTLTEGLKEDAWHVFSDAKSEDEAYAMRSRILEIQEHEEILRSQGIGTEMSLRVLAALTDPTALVVGLGAGAVSGGTATAGVYGAKALRLKRALHAGLIAGGTSAVIDGSIVAMNPMLDGEDLAWAVGSSALLGGVIGGAMPIGRKAKAEIAKIVKAEEGEMLRRAGVKLSEKGEAHYGPARIAPATPSDEADEALVSLSRSQRMADVLDRVDSDEVAFGAKANPTRAGFLWGSKNKAMRNFASALVDYAPGYKNKNAVNKHSAIEWKAWKEEQFLTSYQKSHIGHFNSWLKVTGKTNIGSEFRTGLRAQFNERVAQIHRGAKPGDNPLDRAAKAMADDTRKLYADQLELQKKWGVKGADAVDENDRYLTRQWQWEKVHQFDELHGAGAAAQKLAGAIIDLDGTLTPERRLKIAEGFLQVIRRSTSHQTRDLGSLMALPEKDLAALLRNEGFKDDVIDDLVGKLAGKKRFETRGKGPRMKHRMKLDEAQVEDFLNNDHEMLFRGYTQGQMGRASLARMGIYDDADFEEILQQIEKSYDDAGDFGKGFNRRKAEMDTLKQIHNALMGRPIQGDPSGGMERASRIMRGLTFSQVMNQVGFAQIPELGNVIAQNGMRVIHHAVPALRSLRRDLKTGKLKADEVLDSVEVAFGGIGSRRMLHALAPDVEDFGATATGLGKVEMGIRKMNKVTSTISGMDAVTMGIQRLAVRSQLDGFVKEAMKGKSLMNQKRMNDFGISAEMRPQIMARIRDTNLTQVKTGKLGGLQDFNFDAWPDDEVTEAFSLGMRRWALNAVQEVGVGDKLIGGDHWFMKTLFQYRTFMIGAINKQSLMHLKHFTTDPKSFFSLMNTMMIGSAVYTAQMHLRAKGREDLRKDDREFLEERLGTSRPLWEEMDDPEVIKKIIFAGVQRSGASSILPSMIDSGAQIMGHEGFFNVRTTGLSTGVVSLDANPTSSMLKNAQTGFGGLVGAMFSDAEFQEREGKALARLLPFNNALGMEVLLQQLIEDKLPEHE